MKIFDVGSLLSAAALVGAVVVGATAAQAQGRGDGPIIYVTSQGLYYDSIVTASQLPRVKMGSRVAAGGSMPTRTV